MADADTGADLARTVRELASPDPRVRDAGAYARLHALVTGGETDAGQRRAAADDLVTMLGHGEIQARSFAILGLAVLVEHGDWHPAWFAAARSWYLAETDLRGHDPELGWLHAVAHGADFFGACAAAGRVPASEVLQVLASRLVQPTEWVWHDLEESRVASAIALALGRCEDAMQAVGWLDAVSAYVDSVGPGPMPQTLNNVLNTLRALHIGLGQTVVVGDDVVDIDPRVRQAVRDRCLQVCQVVTPWFWR